MDGINSYSDERILNIIRQSNNFSDSVVESATKVATERQLMPIEEIEKIIANNKELEVELETLPETGNPIHTPQNKVDEYILYIEARQNLTLGVIAGLIAAVVSALFLAFMAVKTGYVLNFAAIIVGFIVGITVRFSGKGIENKYGIIGAILAIFGCFLGIVFTGAAFISEQFLISYWDAFIGSYDIIALFIIENTSLLDLGFYLIAAYEGYRFSFRDITNKNMAKYLEKQKAN